MKTKNDMENRKAGSARAGIWIGILIALASVVPAMAQPAPLYMSGIFRASIPGVKTKTALSVPDTEFFAAKTGTIATMAENGYTLTDLDIDITTGHRYYSAIFKSGESSTQYWELEPDAFASKVAALAQQSIYLISLHAYYSLQNGDLIYSGIFQPGTGPQKFSGSGELDYQEFQTYVRLLANDGYFLTSVATINEGGQNYYVGAFRGGLAQGLTQYDFFVGDWDSMANEILVDAANGLRLVSLNDDGEGNYAGAWIAGRDPFEVVAATTVDVFTRKVTEQAAAGLSPVRILSENSYEPPIGLALGFYNQLDGTPAGGYSYWVSEKGSVTAMGGAGMARTSWDPTPTPMAADTRLDVGSVTKWVTAAAVYKAIEGSKGAFTLDSNLQQVLGSSVNWQTAGKYVNQVKIVDLLNMAGGIYEGSCDQGANYYSANSYLACVVQNCTKPYTVTSPGTGGPDQQPASSTACYPPGLTNICGPPTAANANGCYHYSDPEYGILKIVVEDITGQDFETYVNNALFLPLGVNSSQYSATDIRNANCHIDFVTPTRTLYYGRTQTSGPGVEDQIYNGNTMISPELAMDRSVAVCGSGGMQITTAQAAKFWIGMMAGKALSKNSDLDYLLNLYMFNLTQSWTTNWAGPSYNKNGVFTIYNGQGQVAFVVAVPAIDTQMGVFANLVGKSSTGADFGSGEVTSTVNGLDWMSFHPVDTVSVVNQNSAAFGPMCFNVSGGGAAQNTAIIQWTCGPKPLPANELFTKVDSVSGNGTFMLQAPQTLWTGAPMCITSEYDNTSQNDQMILYGCNGLSNQMFKLGKPDSKGFSNIVVQVSKQCLTVDQNSIYSGANILQEDCVAGESSQEWAVESATAQ